MILKEVRINRYGPLANVVLSLGPGLHVVQGPNESGKTLLVEAIIRLLVPGRRSPALGKGVLERVPSTPDGHLLFADVDGKDLRIPQDGSLSGLLEVSPEDVRNVFVIRNSDLALTDDAGYLTQVQDRLTGLETEAAGDLIARFRAWGRITDTGRLKNDQDSNYLSKRYREAEELGEEIRSYLDQARQEGAGEREARLFRVRSELGDLRLRREIQERAQLASALESGLCFLEEYQGLSEQIRQLGPVDSPEAEDVFRLASRLEHQDESIEGARRSLREARRELEEARQQVRRARREFEGLASARHTLEELRGEVGDWLSRAGERDIYASRAERAYRLSGMSVWAGGILSAAALMLSLAGDLPIWAVPAAATPFLLLALVLYGRGHRAEASASALTGQFTELAARALPLGIEGDRAEEIALAVGERLQAIDRAESSCQEAEAEFHLLQKRAQEIRSRLDDLTQDRHETNGNLNRLLSGLGAKGPRDLAERRRQKADLKERLTEVSTRLRASLGDGGKDPVSWWKEKLDELEVRLERLGGAPDEAYSPGESREIEQRTSNLEKEEAALTEELSRYRDYLREVERRASMVLEEEILLASLEGLQDLMGRLEEFSEAVDRRRRQAETAISILERIQVEERGRIADLLGPESPASRYLESFTRGRYREVHFEPESGSIGVRRQDGLDLPPGVLSQGTFDQLYMSIRLALAGKILKDRPGFFVLDDPFLASDSHRMSVQMKTLADLACQGHVFLLLTVRDDAASAARELGAQIITLGPLGT